MKKPILLVIIFSFLYAVSSASTSLNNATDSLKRQNDTLKSQVISLNKIVDSLNNVLNRRDTGVYFQLIQAEQVIVGKKQACRTVNFGGFSCRKKNCRDQYLNIYIDSMKFVFQNDSLKDIRLYTATQVYKIDTSISTTFSDKVMDLEGTEYTIKLHRILDIIKYSKISDKKRKYHILLTPAKNEKLIF